MGGRSPPVLGEDSGYTGRPLHQCVQVLLKLREPRSLKIPRSLPAARAAHDTHPVLASLPRNCDQHVESGGSAPRFRQVQLQLPDQIMEVHHGGPLVCASMASGDTAGGHHEQRYPQRKQIHRAGVPRLPHLRRRVPVRPHVGLGPPHVHVHLRQTKIRDLAVVPHGQDHIFRLQVPVNDVPLVQVGQPLQDLRGVAAAGVPGQPWLALTNDLLVQGSAGGELHHQNPLRGRNQHLEGTMQLNQKRVLRRLQHVPLTICISDDPLGLKFLLVQYLHRIPVPGDHTRPGLSRRHQQHHAEGPLPQFSVLPKQRSISGGPGGPPRNRPPAAGSRALPVGVVAVFVSFLDLG
mmetsp:Transcript_46901/g.124059  ORF Transcript_46901/g.124059 Transcript_46901/m.124059 type:complete len:349 (+) Transcript_46901:669-1715(+)